MFECISTLWFEWLLTLHTKSVTKKQMNKCMAEIQGPGGIRTWDSQTQSQYHNH